MKKPLSPTQKAWLAGFIDGEGFIGITFQRKKETSQQSASPLFHPYLIITNTNEDSILYVKKLIREGCIYKLKGNSPRLSPTFQYKLTTKRVLKSFLKEVEPFLIVKKKQCKLIMKFLEIRDSKKIITGYGSRGKTSFSSEEKAIYNELLVLNRSGKRRRKK